MLGGDEGLELCGDVPVEGDPAVELFDEVALATHGRRRGKGAHDVDGDFPVVAIPALAPMVFDEHEDVVDVDVDLLDEFHFEDEVVGDRFLVRFRALPCFVVQVEVDTPVVFELARGDRVVALEVVEGREDVAQAQDLPHEVDELLLFLFGGDRSDGQWEVDSKLLDGLQVGGQVLAVGAQEDLATRFLVAEQGDRVVRGVFEVAEADDVSVGLDRVEDSVCARKGLDEAVGAQVLVDPQGVEGLGVEAGEEHVHDDDQVDAPVGQGLGEALVVAFESRGIAAVVGPELLVVVGDRLVEEGTVVLGEGRGVHGFFGEQAGARSLGVGRV